MEDYKYSLSLYRQGTEHGRETKYYVHMDGISGEDTLFSKLDLVTTFPRLSVGQLNYVNELVYGYKGPQSDLLAKINRLFELH